MMELIFQHDEDRSIKRGAWKVFKKQSRTNIAKYELSPHTERIFRQNARLIDEYKRKNA